jgi:hypothetical protein
MRAKLKLVVSVPSTWVAVGNGIETRCDAKSKEGARVLEKTQIGDFLEMYDG